MTKSIHKQIGFSALLCGLSYAFGLVFFVVFFPDAMEAENALSQFLEKKALYEIWNTVIYLVFGFALLYLVHALQKQSEKRNFSYPVGLVWATMVLASGSIALIAIDTVSNIASFEEASSVWKSVNIIQNALGGGIEVMGGVWTILVSRELCLSQKSSKWFSIFGAVTGLSGILTVFSELREVMVFFGLLQMIWFVILGLIFIKNKT